MNCLLRGEKITKIYKTKNTNSYKTKALSDINIEINEGDFIAIMGKSGSGKSTLLNILSGIDRDVDGDIFFKGKNIKSMNAKSISRMRRKDMGFIFQNFNLLDAINLEQNIMLPLLIDNVDNKEAIDRTISLANQFNVEKLLKKYPYQVSGGEAQRASICRALANRPNIIFADEPTGNLDTQNSKQVIEMLQTENGDNRTTILLVTHDSMIASYCKEVIFIKDGKIFERKQRQEERNFHDYILKAVNNI